MSGSVERYTPEQIITALEHTKGMRNMAARMLGCDPDTISNYVKRYPEIKAVADLLRGEMVDHGELKLWNAIQNGEPWAITLCLKTLGKDRGYVERQEHTGADGGPLDVRSVPLDERRERINLLIAKRNGTADADG